MDGKWEFTVHTYMGDMRSIMEFKAADGVLTGTGTDASNGASSIPSNSPPRTAAIAQRRISTALSSASAAGR